MLCLHTHTDSNIKTWEGNTQSHACGCPLGWGWPERDSSFNCGVWSSAMSMCMLLTHILFKEKPFHVKWYTWNRDWHLFQLTQSKKGRNICPWGGWLFSLHHSYQSIYWSDSFCMWAEIAFPEPLLYPGLSNKHLTSSRIFHQNLQGQHC